jgi:estrone sulfotransferase
MSQVEDESATNGSSEAISFENYAADLISKLPSREGRIQPMILYKNYWFCPSIIESILRAQNSFKPRPEDTIIATYLKCGTTWLKALAFAVTNRSQYEFDNHPLLFRHPQEVLPFIEAHIQGNLTYLDTLPHKASFHLYAPFIAPEVCSQLWLSDCVHVSRP